MEPLVHKWEQKYLDFFKGHDVEIKSGSLADDFNYFFNFKKIIVKYSTFSYWAAFLSSAETIYSFRDFGVSRKRLWFFSFSTEVIHKKNFILSKLIFWKHFNVYRTKNMYRLRENTLVSKSSFIDPEKLSNL